LFIHGGLCADQQRPHVVVVDRACLNLPDLLVVNRISRLVGQARDQPLPVHAAIDRRAGRYGADADSAFGVDHVNRSLDPIRL
jgi:hypothetical protein